MRSALVRVSVLAISAMLVGCARPAPVNLVHLDVARVANSEISAGPMRMIFNLRDDTGKQVGGPEIPAHVFYYRADDATTPLPPRAEPFTDTAMTWVAYPDGRGLYASEVELPGPGYYEAEIVLWPPGGSGEGVRTRFEALPAPSTPAIGADAPRSATKTIDDRKIEDLTTDPRPDPDLYQMSVADAVTSGRPSVIVFSTPARCTSNTCGPALDVVKEVARAVSGVNFVHVEIYDNPSDPRDDSLVPAVGEWRLPTEPWVFVVSPDGKIAAKFEGMLEANELRTVLTKLGGE